MNDHFSVFNCGAMGNLPPRIEFEIRDFDLVHAPPGFHDQLSEFLHTLRKSGYQIETWPDYSDQKMHYKATRT